MPPLADLSPPTNSSYRDIRAAIDCVNQTDESNTNASLLMEKQTGSDEGDPSAPYRDSSLNELIYVVVVIMFYATALMVMVGSQVRKSRREAAELEVADYYGDSATRTEARERQEALAQVEIIRLHYLSEQKRRSQHSIRSKHHHPSVSDPKETSELTDLKEELEHSTDEHCV